MATQTYEPNLVLSNEEFDTVGSRPIRPDGLDKVTGRARYSADIHLPGMLHGKVLRSPHAHARIRSIDATQALALPASRPWLPPPKCQRCRQNSPIRPKARWSTTASTAAM